MDSNLWAIIACAAALLSAIFAWRSNTISRKALTLAQQQYRDKQSNFSLYLINSFRWKEKTDKKRQFLIFHCTITNKSESKSSYKSYLDIEFKQKDNSIARITCEHNPKLVDLIPQKNLTVFSNDIRIEEKGIESKWFVFDQPTNVFTDSLIEKYSLKVIDANGVSEFVDTFLMKEIENENI